MFDIKKGIPLPERSLTTSRKYPYSDMEIGDCFDVEAKGKPAKNIQVDVHSMLRSYKYFGSVPLDFKITTHIIGDIVRVWRIK